MANVPTRKKIFELVRERGRNSDGSDRQEELSICEPGEPVELVLEAGNVNDLNAIMVLSARAVGIGYVNADDAVILRPDLQAKRPHLARLHSLRGGVPDIPLYAPKISIVWDTAPAYPHIPLYQDQLQFRRRRNGKGRIRDEAGSLAIEGSKPGCIGLLALPLMAGIMAVMLWA